MKKLYSEYEIVQPDRKNQFTDAPERPQDAISDTLGYGVQSLSISTASRREIGVERAVVISDLHAPFVDVKVFSVMLAIIEDIKPEKIILGGDIADFYAISRYSKDPKRALQLQEELDETFKVLQSLRKAAPDAEIIYVEGNHEFRMRSYLFDKAPQLAGLRSNKVQAQLRLAELDISYIESSAKTAYYRYGPIKIGHFDACTKHSAYTAKLLVDKHHCSIVQGHTHRLGTHYVTDPDGTMIVGMEGGCGCILKADFVDGPNWQHGMTIIEKEIEDDWFTLHQIPIIKNKAVFNSTKYIAEVSE